MKRQLSIIAAASLATGTLAGMLIGNAVAPSPAVISLEAPPSAPPPMRESSWNELEPPTRTEMPPSVLAHPSPEDSCVELASGPGESGRLEVAQPEEELSARLVLEREDALRAWLPFHRFVEQESVETRSMADERLAELFERFVRMNELRTAELVRLAPPPDMEESVTRESDIAAVEAVEARYFGLEKALALEFR